MLLNTIELAILIILPLLIFYQRSSWNIKSYLFLIPLLYIIWYLTYAFLHECSHLLGVWISGKEVFDMRLIPPFWQGEYGMGFIEYDFQGDTQDFFIILLPYLKDIVCVMIGYILLKRNMPKKAFTTGLILTLFIFSPLYDISNNYIAFLLGHMNDFNSLKVSSYAFISHSIGISFIAISLAITIKVVMLSKDYPDKN